MPTHRRDLERHPAFVLKPGDRSLHKAVIAVDDEGPRRASLFLDGREIVVSVDGIEAYWDENDLHRVSVDILAETIEVISWNEMEKRAY